MDKQKLIAKFTTIVGDKHFLQSDTDTARFLDEPRKKFFGKPLGVILPADTQQVSQVLRLANETGTAIVPQGGNTGLVGGQIPDNSGTQIVLSLVRMSKIRSISPTQNSMIVEAGATLETVQRAAQDADRFFPLSLASQGSCTIGGNLASNAGGVNVVAYGNARQLCLGLEVVMADGQIWNGLSTLAKDNTGYDLKNLFIGSEGTLGIITAAAVKLFFPVVDQATAFIAIDEPANALELLNLAQTASGQQVTTIELLPRRGLEFTVRHGGVRDPLTTPYKWYVLLELSSTRVDGGMARAMESTLERAIKTGIARDAIIAQSGQQRKELWTIRETLPDCQKPEGGSIKHDVSVPLDKIPAFLEVAQRAVLNLIPDARPVPFGHIGDGNIHFNITQPKNADRVTFLSRWEEVNKIVHDIVIKMGGSISAEHGIGQLKRPLMRGIKSALELEMMAGIKQQFDPNDILNPGKVLP